MMTSSVMRNLPTLVLAITVALSLFYLWKTLNVIDGRVGRLEHEVMCVLEVVNHMALQPAEPAQREAEVEVPQNAVVADEEASSVGDADVEIINPVGREAHPGKHDLMQRFHTDASSASKEGEDDFLSLQKHLQGARQSPPEGEGSETTDASALQSLSTRKRVPPFPASSSWLHLGSRVTHNGQEYEVIKTKNNILRWGRPRPHGPGEDAPYQGVAEDDRQAEEHADDEQSPEED